MAHTASIDRADRILGTLWGQVVGDALGLGTEFLTKEEVHRHYPGGLTDYGQIIQDYHRERWPRGAWTDDTDMMLCILRAYGKEGFDLTRVALNFKEWYHGTPLGIGSHMSKVLGCREFVDRPYDCSQLFWELSRRDAAANGALMRTSVVGLAPHNVEAQAADICRLTHYDPRCVGSCVIHSLLIHNLVWHDRPLTHDEIKAIADRHDPRIAQWIDLAHDTADISGIHLDHLPSIGYTLRTLAASLWCYWHAPSFEEGLLAIVNEGGDADTNGAVAASLLGALYGHHTIPTRWLTTLHDAPSYRRLLRPFLSKLIPARTYNPHINF